MTRTLPIPALIVIASATLCSSQPAAPAQPQFEVASIKPVDPANTQKSINLKRGELKATSYSLRNLIQLGWNVRGFQILGGPAWLDSEKYNIDAKPAAPLDVSARDGEHELRLMVQSMLADRYRLKLHQETQEMRVLYLTVGRNGASFKRSGDAPGPETSMRDGSGWLKAVHINMGMLAGDLGSELGVTAIDKTNLDGVYDIALSWNPDEGGAAPAAAASPSMFTAIQEQLGLRLEPGKGPVEVLVVDHAEKASAN